MTNLINAFWALFAVAFGIVSSTFVHPFGLAFASMAPSSEISLIIQFATFTYVFLFCIGLPVMIARDDSGRIKKAFTNMFTDG